MNVENEKFDELCYSISAINFPLAPLSKMESRMIESLFPCLIFRQLSACIVCMRGAVTERDFFIFFW